jgi:GNAT superfamily N-acetyltransferase
MIRPRTADDIDECVSLLAAVHRTSGYPAHWPSDPARWLAPSRLLDAWVAVEGDSVIGHIGLSSAGGDASAALWAERSGRPVAQAAAITRLYVADRARGHKLGERLLDEACAAARQRGLHPVLDVLDHNRTAVALYERCGWVLLSTTDLTLPDGRVLPMLCYAAPED